jgi:hypothetical protein
MKTKTQYHQIPMDTVPLVATLKRIERKPYLSRQMEFRCQNIRKELASRIAYATL